MTKDLVKKQEQTQKYQWRQVVLFARKNTEAHFLFSDANKEWRELYLRELYNLVAEGLYGKLSQK